MIERQGKYFENCLVFVSFEPLQKTIKGVELHEL